MTFLQLRSFLVILLPHRPKVGSGSGQRQNPPCPRDGKSADPSECGAAAERRTTMGLAVKKQPPVILSYKLFVNRNDCTLTVFCINKHTDLGLTGRDHLYIDVLFKQSLKHL